MHCSENVQIPKYSRGAAYATRYNFFMQNIFVMIVEELQWYRTIRANEEYIHINE
jgi:hypothetical protein